MCAHMADIRNAYLQSPTSQKSITSYVSQSFEIENVGKVAIMHRAIYDGKSSGRRFQKQKPS